MMKRKREPDLEDGYWCRITEGDQVRTTFTMTIEGFRNRKEKSGEYIESSPFYVNGPGEESSKWRLLLYPKGDMAM